MGMIPHPIQPGTPGDEERFEADLLDMVKYPGKWGMQQANAKELYKRMSLVGNRTGRKKTPPESSKSSSVTSKQKGK